MRERILRQHPRIVGNAALRSQGFLAADGDAPQTAIDRIGGAEWRHRQLVLLEILELFGPLESAVAHRRDDLEIRSQRAQCDFEAHLVVARGGAAMRDHFGSQRQRHLRNGLRLQNALGADAQRIHIAAADIAHDQEFEHLIKVRALCVDQVMFDGAQLRRALGQRFGRLRIDAAGIDGHGDDGALIGVLQPRHAERGVEAAGKSQENGLGARAESGCHGIRILASEKGEQAIAELALAAAPAVAMKIVSSPEIVPTTSGHRAVSMATATLCAEPMVVFSTVRLVPAVRRALTNCLSAEKSFFGCSAALRQHIAIAHLGDAQLAQIPADAGLRRDVAELAQQVHEFGLAADVLLANDFREHRAARRRIVVFGLGSQHFRPLHKIAHILHKNASTVKSDLSHSSGRLSALGRGRPSRLARSDLARVIQGFAID